MPNEFANQVRETLEDRLRYLLVPGAGAVFPASFVPNVLARFVSDPDAKSVEQLLGVFGFTVADRNDLSAAAETLKEILDELRQHPAASGRGHASGDRPPLIPGDPEEAAVHCLREILLAQTQTRRASRFFDFLSANQVTYEVQSAVSRTIAVACGWKES